MKGFLILPCPLINLEIQRYFRNELKFKGVYSRNNLPDIPKDKGHVRSLD